MADETIITPTNNGPLHVRGNFKIVMPSGRQLESDGETWLCRCGGSQTKPFCDGTHAKLGFAASEAPATRPESTQMGDVSAVVAEDADVQEGDLIGVEVDGQPVVVGRVDGQLYALAGLCSHAHARLEEGELEGPLLVCPRHGGAFDIRTGAPARLPVTTPLPQYAVTVEHGRVLVSRDPTSASVPS
jgi:3-phenylpropionate/trans-cinnamate dioxygenase ferredoxin subunit